jgi:glucosamine 6-phosphate synthetase-like amidotransferase/phosphosugar isomerase protein
MEVSARAAVVLNRDEHLRLIAHDIAKARAVAFLARGASFPTALEGALKLKEIPIFARRGMQQRR